MCSLNKIKRKGEVFFYMPSLPVLSGFKFSLNGNALSWLDDVKAPCRSGSKQAGGTWAELAPLKGNAVSTPCSFTGAGG